MVENKLKSIISRNEYTKNPIVNYLKYWSLGNTTHPTSQKIFGKEYKDLSIEQMNELRTMQDEWRKKYDLDVIWLEGDSNADTIFSLWSPLKMVLECLNPAEKFYKEDKYGTNPNSFLEKVINNIDNYLPCNDDLVEELYKFAELAVERANVMRLPFRGMQNRGIVVVSGKQKTVESFHEQMPRTLFECFEGGKFRNNDKGREYFKSDEDLKDWVIEQHLAMFFVDGVISKKTIKPLIKRMKPNESEWLNKKEELLEMLKNYNEILEIRQKKFE